MKKLLLLFPLLLLLGCVANKEYRKGTDSIITVNPPAPAGGAASKAGCQPKPLVPCMAFLEFDDFGEMWEPEQLTHATDLIESAKTPGKHPVVITFVHGWKNNADPKRDKMQEGNAFGFGQALIPLAQKYKNTPVIGVYIAWRGELVSKYWPVRRQFSYFNREEAATRIPGARMTNALAHIVRAAHNVDGYAVLVGHSFGGLVMERALTQATVEMLQQRPKSEEPCTATNGERMNADLTVFVNSAAAATEAKQMLDVLKDYEPCDKNDKPRNPDTALFISISSVSDSATKFALPIGHGLPFLRYKMKGSLRGYDPLAHSTAPVSQGSFYLSSAAHMGILQSHKVRKIDPKDPNDANETKACQDADDRRKELSEAMKEHKTGPDMEQAIEKARNAWPYFRLPDTQECYKIEEIKDAWNNTPYWLMEVPTEVIPDHSTIFTGRFIAMLQTLVPSNAQVEAGPPAAKSLRQMAK